MRSRLSPYARPLLWWLAPMVSSSLGLRILNETATSLHPVGPAASLLGMVAILLTIVFTYHWVRLGGSHAATRLAGALALSGLAGVALRWVPGVAPAAGLGAAIALALALRSAEGRREVVLLAAVLAGSVLVEAALLAGGARYLVCDPRHRWLCEARSLCFAGLLVAAVVWICAVARSVLVGRTRVPAAA
jgi:hypothetical protein